MSNAKDLKILEGIAAGDEGTITAFYKKNLPYIKGYILQNSGNEEDVEDVFQDAMVLVYQKAKTDALVLHSSLQTYFYGVCKNIWRNRLRKNKKIVRTDDLSVTTESVHPAIIQEIERNERDHVYRKYFIRLSDRCKEVLSLVFEGKSMKEISGITGYSETYTRKKKFECKQSLIHMIEKDPIYKELQQILEKK
ncbi:sigma-70 family RNA polymerase sigma factor [Aquimarina sp. U1-2]|uniref:RNA polymerase sigma factor n=1 Tax=Aquimarina sp. U1-2 TaxID=2823141 RepID=UPI001AECDD3A|nr:sigma-70 family RNA polymerase sigma factor [Aquimarina sp. U1-2]MBP2831749.1 sigma-70 family RNA polymerase sigma factor [Aquimarina sp. U1-2]